ncbi:MAG: hypothetical protein V7K39_21165 [Nostoc sp.]
MPHSQSETGNCFSDRLSSNTVQNEQQNTCRDGDLSRLENPKLLPVDLNPIVLAYHPPLV